MKFVYSNRLAINVSLFNYLKLKLSLDELLNELSALRDSLT